MSETIHNNLVRDREEMVVDIYESVDHVREDPDWRTNTQLHNTGRVCVNRYRAAIVCLVLLCFLLLMVIILMCVQTKRSTKEKKQLLINISNITDQKNQLLNNITIITDQRNQLLTDIGNLVRLNEELNQEKHKTRTLLTDGWIYYNYSFYLISTEKKSWTDSRSYCREKNADLIIINSEEEHDFVRSKIGNDFWTGLTDSDKETDWKWVDGTKLTLTIWIPGEPNNAKGDEDCVVAKSEGWNDRSCQDALKWICETIVSI